MRGARSLAPALGVLFLSCASASSTPSSTGRAGVIVGRGARVVGEDQPLATTVVMLGGLSDCGAPSANIGGPVHEFLGSMNRHLAARDALRDLQTFTADDVRDLFLRRSEGPLLAVYAGHAQAIARGGARGKTTSLCLAPPMLAETLLDQAALTATPAVLVLGACQTAFVDVSRLLHPVSVISASPQMLGVDPPEFLSLVADALRSDLDLNCDGLETDEELFAYIAQEAKRRDPFGPNRPIPKLRRQADVHLPIARRWPPRARCPSLDALESALPLAGAIGRSVEQQLGYARGKGELDFGARHADALFVSFEGANTAGVQDEIARRLEPVALSAKLEVLSRELPVELARQLGDVAIAGEVYELRFALSKRPDQPKSPAAWRDARVGVEVIHSRERLLLAAAQFDGIEALTRALPALLPTRAAVTEARAGELSLRIVGTVTEGSFQVPGHGGTLGRADWLAVPCAAEEGQCFTAAATVAQAESARP